MNTILSNSSNATLGKVLVLWAVGVSAVLTYSLSVTVFSQSDIERLPATASISPWATAAFPQGWAFFTKSPRTPEVQPFQVDGTTSMDSLALGPNSSPRWLFGLNRTSRIQEFELGEINRLTSQVEWTDCDGPLTASCVEAARAAGAEPVDNPFPLQTLCGTIALVREEPVPWAFANRGIDTEPPADLKVVDVRC